MLRDRSAVAQGHEQDSQEQTDSADGDVNLSDWAPEVGRLQPEARSEASSLTASPLLQSAGNHVNSGGE